EIADLIEKHQGEVFFSDQPFRNGSERVAAAIADIECDICINIQGDEVFITPEVLDRAVQVLERRPELQIATAVFPIDNGTDLADRNLVKVKVDNSGTVTAFSRDPINAGDRENHGHVGIYAYRKPFLLKFARLQPTAGEIEQSLEQLRIIEHGFSIGAAILPQPLMAINSPADLVQAEKLLAGEKGS
ncbi:MAG: hypothetical protein KAT58_07670, partial [candidate division Zixibacteria bacterium]|nr:hypothetical protein [candidate division Zixibacteria bacterium]